MGRHARFAPEERAGHVAVVHRAVPRGQSARPHGRGSIINVSSTYGLVSPDQSVYDYRRHGGAEYYKPVGYSVAKSGVLNFTRWLAEYCAPFGLRVNTLAPGGVQEAGHAPEFVAEYEKRTPLGRMATDEDFDGARAVSRLARLGLHDRRHARRRRRLDGAVDQRSRQQAGLTSQMGEKDHSDKRLAGEGELALRPAGRDPPRAARQRRRSDRARGAARGSVPPQHAVHDHAGRIGTHRLELQLDGPDLLALDLRSRRCQQRPARRRHLFLFQGTRCAGALFAAHRARQAGRLAAAQAPAARRAARASRCRGRRSSPPTPARSAWASRRRTAWHARSASPDAQRRPHRGDDRRRRTPGRTNLGVAAAGGQRSGSARSSSSSITTSCSRTRRSRRSAIWASIEDKFRAFGWEVQRADGHDLRAVRDRVRAVRRQSPIGRRCSSRTRSRARACRSWKAWRAATRPTTSTPARRV